jgi:hypothetical protein
MKKSALLVLSLIFSSFCFGQVNPSHQYVNGYYKSNGTYVQGHYRTNSNHTNRDNYSTYPNINPHTGNQGTIAPDNNYSNNNSFINDLIENQERIVRYHAASAELAKIENERKKQQEIFSGKDFKGYRFKNGRTTKEEYDKMKRNSENKLKDNEINLSNENFEFEFNEHLIEDQKSSDYEIMYSPFDVTRPQNAKTYSFF